ncbi:DNA adenine methylase [candidate division KSB1 bacterium]
MMNSFIPRFGGKSNLAKIIVRLIPKHICFVEVFCGAAWIFFKKEPSKVEILNDLDNELINLFRIVQNHYSEFVRSMKDLYVSRTIFDELIGLPLSSLTDIKRAARLFYLLKVSFSARMQTYGYSIQSSSSFNKKIIDKVIKKVSERLDRVNIECLDFEDCIKRYDHENTFFYLDPPYFGLDCYEVKFNISDHLRLWNTLNDIKGKFILSYNNLPIIHEVFNVFYIREENVFYPSSRFNRKKHSELLISNYDTEGL